MTRLTRPRLCVVIDAGIGKTTAMQQLLYGRNTLLPGHLAMGFRFAELPDEAADYLDGDRPWLPRRFGDSPATRELSERHARELIRRKIRQGQFTLVVDALDQSRSVRDSHRVADALAKFLTRYPKTHCVVSGRPYSIVDRFWNDLFVDGNPSWEFAQIDLFDKQQQEAYVGPERWQKLLQLEAAVSAMPRMMETVRHLSLDELEGVRTGAELYWRALDETLKDAFNDQDVGIDRAEAEKLWSLIAIELHQGDNFHGIDNDEEFEEFTRQTYRRRKDDRTLARYSSDRDLADWIQKLGRVNEVIDFAVMEDTGEKQLFFRDRTMQDFFAALWMSRYASDADRDWLSQHEHLRGRWSAHAQEAERYDFWKLLVESPRASRRKGADHWIEAVSELFVRTRGNVDRARSSEMIYRAWWGVLDAAGEFATTSSPTEHDVRGLTTRLQWDVYDRVKRSDLIFRPTATFDANRPIAARQLIDQFLAEFPSLRFGMHKTTRHPRAASIAREFDGEWFPTVIPAGKFFMGDPRSPHNDEPAHEASLNFPFLMAAFPLTIELYSLFSPEHRVRFADYGSFSNESRCPVIYANWYDAWCVATWLHARLPDEYEWERACRGPEGTTTRRRWCVGDNESKLGNVAWYASNSGNRTHAVDERRSDGTPAKMPNDWGMYHMHGTVWEWTSSWYDADPRKGRSERFVASSRVLRGGAFVSSADYCRSAYRNHRRPGDTNPGTGVRLARALRKP